MAWVVLRPGASADEQALQDQVAGLLAPHKRPRDVRFLDALPRNEMGKVRKAALRPSNAELLVGRSPDRSETCGTLWPRRRRSE